MKKTNTTRQYYEETYKDSTDSEIQKEILYHHRVTIDKLEQIRKNTYGIILILAIPIVIGVIIGLINLK